MEDKTEKHPVTPGAVIPARELLGDMLMQMNEPAKALNAYEVDLKKHRNRFNGLYGAGLAAERSGDLEKARLYYQQLLTIADQANSQRPELVVVKLFLKKKQG
jgi:tetratricopeptide (TPR) repeat protein